MIRRRSVVQIVIFIFNSVLKVHVHLIYIPWNALCFDLPSGGAEIFRIETPLTTVERQACETMQKPDATDCGNEDR